MRRIVILTAVVVVGLAAYLTLWPVPIDPVAWSPPTAPELAGPLGPNHALGDARQLLEGFGEGPEDIVFDDRGRLYSGVNGGRIARIDPAGGEPEVFADTGGRPLGMVFDAGGDLIVADAREGLLSLARDGGISTLATGADGVPFGFADDLDIAPDGTIYLSDASTKFGFGSDLLDIIEHGGHGRLVAHDPATGESSVVLDGLQFANGVTVADDGAFVLVAETGAYRIQRLWLSGPRAGTSEVFADNLPGFPDNINLTERGTVWVAFPSPRVADLDAAGPHPLLRKVMLRLPPSLQPAPIRYGLVVELGPDGEILRSLHDPSGDVAYVTSVMERDGELYLGSHLEHAVKVVRVEAPERAPASVNPS